VREELQRLAGAELLRQCDSSIEGETSYLFWHALTRDVAYAELPRKVRAVKHAGAAQWIEQQAGERRDDHAELLAYQYLTAFDLARAASEVELAESLRGPAVRSLGTAADRALLVDLAAAERFSARGLELAGDGPERLPLLASWGGVLSQRGLHTESAIVLREAVEGLKAMGDRAGAGRAAVLLSNSLEVNSSEETVLKLSEEAVDLLDDGHPSVSLLQALSGLAWIRGICGDQLGSMEAARQSIDRAREWGMPVWPGALGALGSARLSVGDLGGLTDYERALEAARLQGLAFTESVLSNNLGFDLLATRGPAAALRLWTERLDLERQRGFDVVVTGLQCSIMQATAHTGRWDEALALADELDARLESSGDLLDMLMVGMAKALVLLLRGDAVAARRLVCLARKKTWDGSHLAALSCWLRVAAATEAVAGHAEDADDLLTRLSAEPLPPTWPEVVLMHPHAIRAALRIGDPGLARRLVAVVKPVRPVNELVIATGDALLAESADEFERAEEEFAGAAARWHDFGVPYEEAQALLGQGRCLVALGRAPEAAAPLVAAREIFARLGARPALAETKVVLSAIGL
jgi:tetratricopeptide (TPR) repeat protein